MINLNKETLSALRVEIAQWQGVAETNTFNTVLNARALCRLFIASGCYGCPVFEATTAPYCFNTPLRNTEFGEYSTNPAPTARLHVQFLQSLIHSES